MDIGSKCEQPAAEAYRTEYEPRPLCCRGFGAGGRADPRRSVAAGIRVDRAGGDSEKDFERLGSLDAGRQEGHKSWKAGKPGCWKATKAWMPGGWEALVKED